MDAQLRGVDVNGITNGDTLKQNARDSLASLRVDSSPDNVNKSIDDIQRLRDAMANNGATTAQLAPIDKQLSQLHNLQSPEVDVMGKLGGVEGMENLRNQVKNVDLGDTLDGTQLKRTAQNALSDLQLNPTEANVDKSIGGIKAMRQAMVENGASKTQLGQVDKQIAQLENLKTPSVDFSGNLSNIKGLGNEMQRQLEDSMNNAVAHPTAQNFANARNLLNSAGVDMKLNTSDLNRLENAKVKLGNAELSSVTGNGLRQAVGDTPQVRQTVKDISNYANHGSIEDFMKAQKGMSNMQQNAYRNGDTKLANEISRQMAQFNQHSVSASTQQATQKVQAELGQNASRSITEALGNYGKQPSQGNFGNLQQAMTTAINDANKDGDNQTNRLLREQLNKMNRTNAGYVNANFANEVKSALGAYAKDDSVQPLLQQLAGSQTTNDKLNVTKRITQAMKQSNQMGAVDTKRLTEAVKGIKNNPINS